MKKWSSVLNSILFIYLLFLVSAQAAATRQWNQGDPSPEEQYALEVVNRIRSDPIGTLELYIKQSDKNTLLKAYFDTQFARDENRLLVYGVDAARLNIKADIASYTGGGGTPVPPYPHPPLVLYPLFTEQAKLREASAVASMNQSSPVVLSPGIGAVPAARASMLLTLDGYSTPSFSGPNATGGIAVVRAGVGTSGPQGAQLRGEYIALAHCPSNNATLREAFAGRMVTAGFCDPTGLTFVKVGFGGGPSSPMGPCACLGFPWERCATLNPQRGLAY